MTMTVDLKEAEQQWPRLLDPAIAGNEVIIAEGDRPVARLTAIVLPSTSEQRIAGLHEGAIWVSDDFDEPLPPRVLD
jgi:antitoxin (DNA-binding transcriptional repressor) of toxin-antitoxin stability system